MNTHTCLFFLWLLPFVAGAAFPANDEILAAMDRLGAESFPVRRDANEQLRSWSGQRPLRLLQLMADRYQQEEDLEIRIRLEELMEPLATRLFLVMPSGFIGINMEWREADRETTGVHVSAVLNGHPADRSGMQAGDVILAINEVRTAELGGLTGFSELVASLPPGTLVNLRILREEGLMDLPLLLGVRPEHLQGISLHAQEVRMRYRAWLQSLRHAQDAFDPSFPIGHFPMD